MMKINVARRNIAIAALILSGLAVSQARANSVVFSFTTPSGSQTSPHTYTDAVTGLSVTATGYTCVGATGGLCANDPNTNYSADKTNLYDNSDGLGVANNLVNGKYEIPNSEFVQIDFSSIEANKKVQSIQYQMTDIVTSWSSYGSKVAGELEGVGGVQLVNNSAATTLQTITSPAYGLYSFIAGTNCDVVLTKIIVNYTDITPSPEPATFLISGLVLLGLVGAVKKSRKIA